MSIEQYLILGTALFLIGLFIVLTKKNAIMILMGLELMFNGANVNLVGAGRGQDGNMFALFIIVIAACELAIALVLIYKLFHQYRSSDIDVFTNLGEEDVD